MLEVFSDGMNPLKNFFGSNNIKFIATRGGRFEVDLLPNAIPHFTKFKGDIGFKNYLLNAITDPSKHYFSLNEVSLAYRDREEKNRSKAYSYTHPMLGWVKVDEEGNAEFMNSIFRVKKSHIGIEEYFDITRLYEVLDANKYIEGKNFMKFWADGHAATARADPIKGKSTIGANIYQGLRIYIMDWRWILSFSYVKNKYDEFFKLRAKNAAVKNLLINKYSAKQSTGVITPFNDWLINGLSPQHYLFKIKDQQLQFIHVDSHKLNNSKFDDMVAALNGFHFYAFYKGATINVAAYKSQMITHGNSLDPLSKVPKNIQNEIKKRINNPSISHITYISHIGIYAGDLYEFIGSQYLATWDLVNNKVNLNIIDIITPWERSNGNTDVKITNKTFDNYRKATGKGGDFIALSPVKLVPFAFVV